MSKPIVAAGGILIVGLIIFCFAQRQSATKLREQTHAMQQQLDQLAVENERLSNSLLQASTPQTIQEDQMTELLRLRNEVSMLRTLTNGAQPPDYAAPRIGDLEIVSARFAAGTNAIDVTARVIELLHREPAGFSARADWLKADPAPYRSKTLVIIYNYGGRQNLFSVVGGEKVSYDVLVANAGK